MRKLIKKTAAIALFAFCLLCTGCTSSEQQENAVESQSTETSAQEEGTHLYFMMPILPAMQTDMT